MSAFEETVATQLEGIFFFSVGACPGCETCGLGEEPSNEDYDAAQESSFSWSSCDSCRSSLGGDRHPAHGIIAESEEAARGGDIEHFSVCVDCLHYHANGTLPEEQSS